MIYFGVTVNERSMVYIRHHDLFFLVAYSAVVDDLKLVVYYIQSRTQLFTYISVLSLLKTKDNSFFVILVMIFLTKLFELTHLFYYFSHERRM